LWSYWTSKEVIMLKILSETNLVPQILGRCGHFHIEEMVRLSFQLAIIL